MLRSTVVMQRRIVGTWQRPVKRQSVTITVTPFRLFGANEVDELAAAAKRYGDFPELLVRLLPFSAAG